MQSECPKCHAKYFSQPPRCNRCGESLRKPTPDWRLKESQRSYILRHWFGDLTLSISYWVNGIVLTGVFVFLIALFTADQRLIDSFPRLYFLSAVGIWLLAAVLTVWQMIGIWRSASSYLSEHKNKVWGWLAKLSEIFGSLSAVANFAITGIPQIREFARLAAGYDSMGTYQLRVLRDSSELEIAGSIVFGLTDEVGRMLDAHPTIKTLHLNSAGGRVGEARKLRDLITARGLTTYTATECFSACTIAYLAGSRRLIAETASLGFHRYSFPGIKDDPADPGYQVERSDWIARGIDSRFVAKAFTAPSSEMWKPTHRELFEAGAISMYAAHNEVAISGIKLENLDKLESELNENPLFAALKTYESSTYERILRETRIGLQKGRSKGELHRSVFRLAQSLYSRRLPYASNVVLLDFTALLLEQMAVLYAVNPWLCYEYIHNAEQASLTIVTKYFSDELQKKELSVMARVIETAAKTPTTPPSENEIPPHIGMVMAELSSKHGDQVQVMINPELAKSNKAKGCEVLYDFYGTILRQPLSESGPLLRYMFAHRK